MNQFTARTETTEPDLQDYIADLNRILGSDYIGSVHNESYTTFIFLTREPLQLSLNQVTKLINTFDSQQPHLIHFARTPNGTLITITNTH